MASDLSSNCECSTCLERAENESDWSCSSKSNNYSLLYSRPRKTSRRHSFLSQCCPSRPEVNNKEESVFLPSGDENYVGFSQNNHISPNSKDITKNSLPFKELTIQELLKHFADIGKFQSNSTSLGHFRDQVVMKFRRALYYSGVWVTHVRGYRVEKHFSAKYFKRNPNSLHRLIPWLKRELTAVYGDYGYTVKNILAAILHHMTEYDLDSESFIHLLEPYLLQYTHHFLHEFISFVHSPYNMETYDQRAIYECPAHVPLAKKRLTVSAPILPLPKDQVVTISQNDAKQSENMMAHWENEERPPSGWKKFPNGNASRKESEISPVHHKTASKAHVWIKDKQELGHQRGIISTDNMLLSWTSPRKRDPNIPKHKNGVQEKKTQGVKLLPGYEHDLRRSEIITSTCSTPVIPSGDQAWKYRPGEINIFSSGQQINLREDEGKKNKYLDTSAENFQRPPRARSLVTWHARDPSRSCTSENTISSKIDGIKLSSLRKRRMKCGQSSQFVGDGSHSNRSTQRRARSCTRRSKSWCAGARRRSFSREARSHVPRGNHSNRESNKKICDESLEEKNTYGNESNFGWKSSVQHGKISSAAGDRPKCLSKAEGTSQIGTHYSSLRCHNENHTFPNKQMMKQKATFPWARRTRGVKHGRHKCKYPDAQNTEVVSDELSLDDIKQMNNLSDCISSYKRQISTKKNSNFQKSLQAKTNRARN
ncbi:E3 ubiquitin-protein ligase Topors-like [Ochotona curzoniae]|uniref:E3 ubiquitin-protein ligase Topors-like n=1 Tax=Ochotona curzoniae TaxID=130825 RepID=UPI001B34F80C|nr:E3 ubiquitin-protein ligase Topors-like [Ochotona curzoniae]